MERSSGITRLRDFIFSSGGLEIAASRMNVYPSTLAKILDCRDVSAYARKKVEDAIGPLQSELRTTSPPTNSDFTGRLHLFIKDCGSLRDAALRLGLRPSTLEKFLDGKSISFQTRQKIEELVKQKTLSIISRPYPASLVEKLIHVDALYKHLGTLEAVGKELGVTRERVRQLLVKGTRLGLFEYKPYDFPYISKEKLIGDYIDSLSLSKVARLNNISPGYLNKLMTAYSISEKDLDGYGQEGRRKRCIAQYSRIKDKLGHHPTTTELQRTREWHTLNARINRLWGTFDAFRKALNIPKPVHAYPHWLEPRIQLVFIARMQHLDTIRECLSASNPMSVSEIGVTCGFNLNRVRRLLKLLITAGEVQQVGISNATKYRLATD